MIYPLKKPTLILLSINKVHQGKHFDFKMSHTLKMNNILINSQE